jgi:hypothetical protein
MKTNKLTNFLLLLVLALNSCKIGEDSPVRNFYAFEQNVTISPVKKEYTQGDLVWMEVNFPKQMTDQTTGKTVEVGNATFNLNLEVTDPFVPSPDLEKFALIPQNGVVSNDDNFEEKGTALISFGCPANDYSMRVGIQFKEKGGYLVYLNKANPYFQIVFTGDADCSIIKPNTIPPDEADIGTVRLTFALTDTNKDKFDEYAMEFVGASADFPAIRSALDKKEAFFVWVK